MWDEGHGKVQTLAHSARISPGAAVCRILQVDRLKQLGNSLLSLRFREMVEGALEPQVLSAREFVIDSNFLGRVPDDLTDGGGILVHVNPVHDGSAGRLLDERRDHLDRRGLPRTVRVKESEDLPSAYRDGNSIHRADVRIEDLAEILDLNDPTALRPRRP